MNKYYLMHKPYGVLSQFTREVDSHKVLGDYFEFPGDVYPVGRLDKDSEGLLMLTNDKKIVDRLLNPRSEKWKTYLVQVEGDIPLSAVRKLELGVDIKLPSKKIYRTKQARASLYDGPEIPPRVPPIRERKSIPTTWVEIQINEGKNRQVRKMCAAVGYPVLRLIRTSFGDFNLGDLKSGEVKQVFKVR